MADLKINKGKKRDKHVEFPLFAETSTGNDKFHVTYVRGDGEDDVEKLKAVISATRDKEEIKKKVKARIINIRLRDDDNKIIPYSDEVFDWVWGRAAYNRPLIAAMYAAAGDVSFKQDRLGN